MSTSSADRRVIELEEAITTEAKYYHPTEQRWIALSLLDFLAMSTTYLDVSVRCAGALERADIRFVYELAEKTEAGMLKTKNFGRKSLGELRDDVLGPANLRFGTRLSDALKVMIEERIKTSNTGEPKTILEAVRHLEGQLGAVRFAERWTRAKLAGLLGRRLSARDEKDERLVTAHAEGMRLRATLPPH